MLKLSPPRQITRQVIASSGFLRIIEGCTKYASNGYRLVTIVKTLPPALPEEEIEELVFRRWSRADAAELRKTQPAI
jgi:hypothetical protein